MVEIDNEMQAYIACVSEVHQADSQPHDVRHITDKVGTMTAK